SCGGGSGGRAGLRRGSGRSGTKCAAPSRAWSSSSNRRNGLGRRGPRAAGFDVPSRPGVTARNADTRGEVAAKNTVLSAGSFPDSVVGIAAEVASRRRSAADVSREALDRLERYDKAIGAFLEVSDGLAVQEAEEIDRRVARGEHLPLAGVPLAIKDNIWVAGRRVSCASRILEGFRPPQDATAVARLRAAGAVFVGKTNLDHFPL